MNDMGKNSIVLIDVLFLYLELISPFCYFSALDFISLTTYDLNRISTQGTTHNSPLHSRSDETGVDATRNVVRNSLLNITCTQKVAFQSKMGSLILKHNYSFVILWKSC